MLFIQNIKWDPHFKFFRNLSCPSIFPSLSYFIYTYTHPKYTHMPYHTINHTKIIYTSLRDICLPSVLLTVLFPISFIHTPLHYLNFPNLNSTIASQPSLHSRQNSFPLLPSNRHPLSLLSYHQALITYTIRTPFTLSAICTTKSPLLP